MSRADDVRAKYDAELAVIELEEKLVELKESGDSDELAEVKADLRAARQYWRELRAGAAEVDVSAVDTTAAVQE